MKPAPFDYLRPGSIDEAVGILGQNADFASILAGGQTLVPLLALRMATPSVLIDINRIAALQGVSRTGNGTRIAACTRQNEVLCDQTVARHVPALRQALGFVGHHQTRNRGTVGGSIALGEPAAEQPATALALGAEIEVRSARGTRTIPADEFYLGPYTTAIEPDEMIVAVHFPDWPEGTITMVDEVARSAGDFALVGLVAAFAMEGAVVRRAGIAWFGMGSQPTRSKAAEQAICGRTVTAGDLAEIARLAVSETDPMDDIKADAAYRRKIGVRLFERRVGSLLGIEGKAA